MLSGRSWALCGFIALQWAWTSLFHESTYWTFEAISLPFFLNWAVLFCFAWTAGMVLGAAVAFAMLLRNMKPIATHITLAFQVLAGLAFYGGAVFGYSLVAAVIAQIIIAATAMYVMLAWLYDVRVDANRSMLHLVGMWLIGAGCSRLLILAFGVTGFGELSIMALIHMMLLPASYGLLQTFRTKEEDARDVDAEFRPVPQGEEAICIASVQPEPIGASVISEGHWRVWLHLFLYCCVFGLLHRLHGAVAFSVELRIVAYFVSAILVAAAFIGLYRHGIRAQETWGNVSRCIFPTVMVSCLLLPLMDGPASFVVFVLSEFAQGLYLLIVITSCAHVAQETRRSFGMLIAKAMVIWHLGILVGAIPGTAIRAFISLDNTFFSVFSAVVFLVLIVATFELNVQDGIKTNWGLVQEYAPRAMFDERIHRFCEQKAKECGLTVREQEIFEMLAKGQRANDIKDELTLSITTVRTHMQNVYQKLGIHSQKELTAMVREGLEKR